MLGMLALKLRLPILYVLCFSLYPRRIADLDGWLNYRRRETKGDWAVGRSVRAQASIMAQDFHRGYVSVLSI